MQLKDGMEGLTVFLRLHSDQLRSSGVPEHFWESLYTKLKHEVYDAGRDMALARVECEEDDPPLDPFQSWKVLVTRPGGIQAADPECIYLVDHAWTFRPDGMRQQLRQVPALLERMLALVGLESSGNRDQDVDDVAQRLWQYAHSYSIGNSELAPEERVPIWYVTDELGSRLQHSDEPNVRLVPFFDQSQQVAYSLLFAVDDVVEGGELLRDLVEGCAPDAVHRSVLLLPWTTDFESTYLDYIGLEQAEPEPQFFSTSRIGETLPDDVDDLPPVSLPSDRPIRVYAEYSLVGQQLRHQRFQLVDDADQADVLWLISHFKDYRSLSQRDGHKCVNQFPGEHVLTVKDMLCVVARRAARGHRVDEASLATRPAWLPVTYNLRTETAQLVAHFRARQRLGLDNTWIVKPWNLARSLDTHVTDNLNAVLRLATSGPKIAQKYVHRPVLFHRRDLQSRVKFDVRYMVLVRSVKPLRAFAYRRFLLRFANRPFELAAFDEYQRHFTVMNYAAPDQLHEMVCTDFVDQFQQQYPDQKWDEIEDRIFEMLSQLLRAATDEDVDAAGRLLHNPQSRAMYAVDLMLQSNDTPSGATVMEPQLLEVNWAPDCQRVCRHHPEFFDDVFSVLFLDETEGKNVHPL